MLEILQQAQREYEDALNAEKLRTKQVELRTELAWAHCHDKKQVCRRICLDYHHSERPVVHLGAIE